MHKTSTDQELLDAFVDRRDEQAFSTVVSRYSALVMGICKRILGNAADAEDAFQATFIVLSRKASSLRRLSSIPSWLHGVTVRIALKAKSTAGERRTRERRVAQMVPSTAPDPEIALPQLRPVIDEALSALPEKYRAPLVLCYLEGKTNEGAARELGWPIGTMSRRLEKARDLLRGRLVGRGVAVTGGLLAALLAEKAAFATSVPPAIIASATKLAVLSSAGEAAVPVPVALLVKGALKTLFAAQLKVAAAVLIGVGLVGTATAIATYQALRTESLEDPAEVARVDRRIAELWPTGEERRMDEIGWAPDLVTALRLAREHGRPVFVASAVGDLTTGRFGGGTLGMRGLLSDPGVISMLNRSFVPFYASGEDHWGNGRASAADKAELTRIYQEALNANLTAGDEWMYLLGPDGRVLEILPADVSQALPILQRVRDRIKPREGGPLVRPTTQSRPPAHSRDDLVLHLVARYVDPSGAPEKDRQTWHEFPAENWLVLGRPEWARLLPREECALGMTWTPAPDVARRILVHFYPTTEDLRRDDSGRNKVERISLQARVVALRGVTVRARLEGQVRMSRRFYPLESPYPPAPIEATVIGFLEFEPSGRIVSLKLTTDRAKLGDSPFAVAVRSK